MLHVWVPIAKGNTNHLNRFSTGLVKIKCNRAPLMRRSTGSVTWSNETLCQFPSPVSRLPAQCESGDEHLGHVYAPFFRTAGPTVKADLVLSAANCTSMRRW
jgi:hypothetical protein